ncbi:MAG: radical SAM protein [Proteobacteria bacterium]|nr:radical SAM protein [Pseudomonadota bacterium]
MAGRPTGTDSLSGSGFRSGSRSQSRRDPGPRRPLSFDRELTVRCNNDCAHCYINLPACDRAARDRELSFSEIDALADQAVSLGAVWCLLTGGEPLLREDFAQIYLALKKKGLLVSVFTNAAPITEEHVELFKRYPPRHIEATVYGATQETCERVTRRPGSYAAFKRGLDRLLDAGVAVRLKAMALSANVGELPEIARFCRERTKDYFRFDPQLHLKFDGDPARNREIESERLPPEKVVEIERADQEKFETLKKGCDKLITPECARNGCNHLFHCGAGTGSFSVAYDGTFRLCSSLWHPDCVVDLRKVGLAEAWRDLVPRVREKRSDKREFLEKCRACDIINLCLWFPAHAYLETGELDAHVEFFCKVAHARADMLREVTVSEKGDGFEHDGERK